MDPTPIEPSKPTASIPYWQERGGIAPIKSEYVLWEKMKSGGPMVAAVDDDAAEGRTADSSSRGPSRPSAPEPRNDDRPSAPTEANVEGETSAEKLEHLPPSDGGEGVEPPAKKVRLSGAQKKAVARQKSELAWQEKKAAQALARAEGKEEPGVGGGRQKNKGQNKNRKFDHRAGTDAIRLCLAVCQGRECPRLKDGQPCKFDHDLTAYIAARAADVTRALPTTPDDLTPVDTTFLCPTFQSLGACPHGFKCRFGLSHMRQVEEGKGFMNSGWELVVDTEKVERLAKEKGEGLKEIREKGEMNVISMERVKVVRGQGLAKEDRFPLSTAYLLSIGEPVDLREDGGDRGKGNGKGKGKGNPRSDAKETSIKEETANLDATPAPVENDASSAMEIDPIPAEEPAPSTDAPSSVLPKADDVDVDSHPSRSALPDLAPVRASEKRRLDFRGKLYLAPLTTVGNLPFRRLCGDYGNDISCSEMGLAQEFLSGNSSEWSLVRRHPSEKIFGVQICGSRPQTLVPAAEAIVKSCNIDFLDVNCGCPIDLVFNKGAGSALLAHATKLGKSLIGMSQVLGEIPLTIKIRNGIVPSAPVAHKLIPRMQSEWGVSGVTLHGRSRQQRYKNLADYAYISQCAKVLRETAADEGLPSIPIFGNGDAYDYRTYYENMEATGVDGIMIARGALVKPWIFTEIKERRDWDISSRERLDMVGQLASYGIEHWGSDTMGLNTTRRFLCEALSFQHRYVPVGLLERFPVSLNERAFPYKGRDELETLLASDQSSDWVKLTSMFLGPPPDDWSFQPKHKANAVDTEVQG